MTSPREVSVLKMERHKHRSRMVDDFCLIAKSVVIRNQSIMAFTVRQACRPGPGDGWGQYRPLPGRPFITSSGDLFRARELESEPSFGHVASPSKANYG